MGLIHEYPVISPEPRTSSIMTSESKPYHLKFIFPLTVLLGGVALFSHLGYLLVDSGSDEARRAAVSLEMILRDDYITPTLNGQLYLNKPPLYNWIIIFFYKLAGNYSGFTLRLPMILSLLLFAWLIYYFTKKFTGRVVVAYIAACGFVTSGTVLFWDSFQGLIDISYSMVTYLSFMLAYYFGSRQKWLLLFLTTYFLAAVGFLMKGLPSVLFQGILLLVYFLFERRFRRLLTWQHLAGILLFAGLLGIYYGIYFSRNDISVMTLADNLIHESVKKTPAESSLGQFVRHAVRFPLDNLYDFFPWLFMITVLIRKDLRSIIRQNRFIAFCTWLFLVNYVIYWMSPGTVPRYLFMLIPLLYTTIFYLFYESTSIRSWRRRIPELCLGGATVLLALGVWVLPFVQFQVPLNQVWLKVAFLSGAFGLAAWCYFKFQPARLPILVIVLLLARMTFNWFSMTQRGAKFIREKEATARIISVAAGRPIYVYPMDLFYHMDGYAFFFAESQGAILPGKKEIEYGALYIIDSGELLDIPYRKYLELKIPHLPRPGFLVEFIPPDTDGTVP